MCGRYELHSHPAAIALAFGLAQVPNVEPHYNIAPTTDVPIVRVNPEGRRELLFVRWGLVPRWARNPSIGQQFINARGETVANRRGEVERNVLHGDHYVIEGLDKVSLNAKVCTEVDADRFLELFVSRIQGK